MNRQNLAQVALEQCRTLGVEYADVRLETIEDENITVSDVFHVHSTSY